jgi:PhnB protein
MHTQIYLFFDGRTEEALDFYKKTLGVEVEMLMRYKDAPPESKEGCAPGTENKIMHSSFRLGDQRVMASDGYAKGNPEFKGFSLSLATKDEAEAEKVFAALGDGG